MDKNIVKHRYIETFGIVVILLALVRCGFEGSISRDVHSPEAVVESASEDSLAKPVAKAVKRKLNIWGEERHKIYSVPNYRDAFPDTNAVQLRAAQQWGVSPVKNRAEAEERRSQLVYIGNSPYYHVDPLHQSVPYLVPRAAVLLRDIGRAYFDSLTLKGLPLHKFIVTSVLRTQQDVARLRNFNRNATENSCHLYGTTFDIAYNRYKVVAPPDDPSRRAVRDDSLKWVLTEVLNDMRQSGRCYIKYEVKQGCFHMTVR